MGCLVIVIPLIIGCTATRTISDKTVETTTIQPVKINVPDVKIDAKIPLTQVDTVNKIPYGDYESKPIEIEHKTADGTVIKSKAIIKVKLQKSKAKPELNANLSLTETTIETKAQVVDKKETTQSVTETFWQIWGNRFMWGLIIMFILFILWMVLKEKIKSLLKF
jgi:hypothetical protein